MKRNPFYQSFVGINLVIGLIALAVAYFLLPPEIPLFYGNVQASSQLVNRFFFPLPSLLALFFSLANGLFKKKSDLFLVSIFKMITVIVTIFSTLALIKIYWLVGYH